MSKLLKEFHYTNDIGYHKTLAVYEKENDKYPVMLWSRDTGDFCGSGKLTEQELKGYLKHYGITDGI